MHVEHEMKLVMGPEILPRLRRHPLLRAASGRGRTHKLQSVYFDTPGHELYRCGLTLRVRHIGSRRMQTVKYAAAVGVAGRPEWECEIDGDVPDLAAVKDAEIRRRLAELSDDGAALVPVFATDVRRTARLLRLADGSEIELAIDVGELAAGEARLPIHEAELELKSGRPAALARLASALLDDVDFRLESRSKSHRGYALLAGVRPHAVKAPPVPLKRRMSADTAFRSILGGCLAHLEANEACAMLEKDPEGIHQMRVAIRRLRSAFKVFGPVLSGERAAPLEDGLRWIIGELGPARDWDVFAEETVAPLRRMLPEETALPALDALVQAARRDAGCRARAAVDSARYTRLKLGLAELAFDAEEAPAPVGAFANQVLRRLDKKLRKRGGRHARLGPEELHKLRIHAKKVRYAGEFFRRLYGRKASKAYLGAVADLQDLLGGVNDAVVGGGRLRELLEREPALAGEFELVRAAGVVTGWLAAQAEARLRDLEPAWRRFLEADAYWGKEEPEAPAEPEIA